ncbi:MAG: hypothetical protein FWG23_08195 [Eggerthellaceae bacterium]|jgi:hypothetical protein|nr:hypothetical protein [Eggerthellaceae bacterium]MDR2715349.1 hypothetical protein [Coriobacteriaceae bacterium]
MTKNKRLMLVLLFMALVLTFILGATLAALGSTTEGQTNTFAPSESITARLTEPNWEPDEAIKLVPGKTVRKDPMITNTSEVDEYAALRLTFLYKDDEPMSDADLAELLKWVEIDWNDSWVLFGGTLVPVAAQPLVFVYQDAVGPAQATEPLFSSVHIKDKFDTPPLTEDALAFLAGLDRFKIRIEGAAVQSTGFGNAAAASTTLSGLFPTP